MFILSNVLWIVWGVHDGAWALIALQVALMGMNIRGIWKNDKGTTDNRLQAGTGKSPG